MNRIFARASQIILLVVVATPSLAQNSSRTDEVVQSFVDGDQFMGSVLTARGADVLFSKGYGSANLEWSIPNTPQTKFRLGSITKQFTAAAILLLEEQGKLGIDDLVTSHMSDAPPAWSDVTIFHLLTHTSGIPNVTSLPDYPTWKLAATPVEETLGYFREEPLEFTPGERMSYSNSGYLLLGYLIEQVSNQSYESFLRENIFTPLGMQDSGYDLNATVIPSRASGYMRRASGLVNAPYIDMTIPHAAGALYSTTEDLLRWTRGLFGGELLSTESAEKMTTPFKNNYALGVEVREVNGRTVINHGGGIEGFSTHLAYYPDEEITVVALANLNGPAAGDIAGKLGAIALGDTVLLTLERQEVTVPVEALRRYIGTYSLNPNFELMITLDGDQLISQATGQAKVPMFAESETSFFLKVVDAQIEFVEDDNATVTHLILHQGGREMKAERTSDTVFERQEIALAAEVLDKYVGTYEIRPGFDFVITLEDGQLILAPTGQDRDLLYAEAETRFFSKRVDAVIDFVMDENGEVTHLTTRQGQRTVEGRKRQQ